MPVLKEIQCHGRVAKLWTRNIEPEALKQIENVLSLSFLFKHLAVMPDVHKGWGCPVGSVIATVRKVMPACVGVDIGCGMCAVKLPFKAGILEGKLPLIRSSIESIIPTGFEGNKTVSEEVYQWDGWKRWGRLKAHVSDTKEKVMKKMGSLGGGNHFIEVSSDEEGNVWLMLHSGSRHIGKEVADFHVGVAKRLMKKEGIDLPDRDLAYLTEGTDEFRDYLDDTAWTLDYARQNRMVMTEHILKRLSEVLNGGDPIERLLTVNCHHNYVSLEEHYGKKVYITRKGAVSARKDEWGIIPGSMGSPSFIVQGLGNEESYCSCAHGAGRRMSRHEAKRRFKREDLIRQTSGIECRKDKGVLDEIPSAYKDIEEVLDCQQDLVKIEARLKQLICIKG
jgi:tRNA-splicing ligase RtcB